MKSALRFETRSDEETQALGRRLAKLLPDRGIILLIGELGAGKTTLTKGIVEARGAARADDVSSPTFSLIHEYGNPVSVYHIDLYRLDTEDEARRLGLEDLFDQPALVLIEWGERFPNLMPDHRIEIRISHQGEDHRVIELASGESPVYMDTLKAELAEFQNLKDLKTILSTEGPCLSVYVPLGAGQGTRADALEWRECLRSLESKIAQYGSKGRELVESISDWNAISPPAEPHRKSIAVFRSADVFRIASIEDSVKSKAVLGPHFYIRPLLPELTRERSFYILALSQKNVRLLRCTSQTSEEVSLPAGIPTSFDEFMNSVKPDHTSADMSSPGPSSGTSKGITFGMTTDREDKGEHLAHFYRQIDRGLSEALRAHSDPVVPAAVEYELALYRSLSTYPHLAEESVQGAPNSLKSGEMHARALDALLRCYEKKIDEAVAEYNHKVGGGASNRLKDIIPAAHDGRILTLLVSDSLEMTGSFDETTHTVKGRETGTPEDEDLINDAVVQTILHAGQVFVVPNGKMPNGTPLAAIFRF